jgi:hypothetical protein
MQLDFDAFDRRIADGTIIRGSWAGRLADGRKTVCALAALWPECSKAKSASACPADALDPRIAYLIPWLDDADLSSPVDVWLDRLRRLSVALRRVVTMTPPELDDLTVRIKICCVEEALRHVTTDDWDVRVACQQVIAALRGEGDLAAAEASAGTAAGAAGEAAALADAIIREMTQ